MTSFSRSGEDPNDDCDVCADDSLSIVLLELKSMAAFTLQDFKDKVLATDFSGIKFTGQTFMVEFEGNIIYEFDKEIVDNAGDDSDELEDIKRNENRLKKSMTDLKVFHQSIV